MSCKVCGGVLRSFMNFRMPLAGAFPDKQNEKVTVYPLTLSFCDNCTLVQVEEEVDAKILFNTYMYRTGVVQTLVDHFRNFASTLTGFQSILEIGCNDLTFLRNFPGKLCIGVDPSDVSTRAAEQHPAITLRNTFFSRSTAEKIESEFGKMDVIYASNCFAHVPSVADMAEGVRTLMADRSIFIVEVHWVGALIQNLQFPFIYHEHVFYYSLRSFSVLMERCGLQVFRAEQIPIHGGSIRLYCCLQGARAIESSVDLLCAEEQRLRLSEFSTYSEFTMRVNSVKSELRAIIDRCSDGGGMVVGYGASGQANTFLAYCEIGNEQLSWIADDSELKAGRFTSAGLIPIRSPAALYEREPDFIIVLAYTFFDEIRSRHSGLRSKWVIPLPQIRIL